MRSAANESTKRLFPTRRWTGTKVCATAAVDWADCRAVSAKTPRVFAWVLGGGLSLTPQGRGGNPQIAQISADVFTGSTPLFVLRNLRLVTQSYQSFA